MTETGCNWSITAVEHGWAWRLTDRETGQAFVSGVASTRAIAAALIVRSIARGMTITPSQSPTA